MSASRSVGSSKFYLRKTVAWPLCLRHDIFKNEQGIYKMYRNRICTLTRISKQQYYTKFLTDNLTNMKKTWKGINSILSRKSKNSKTVLLRS